MRAKSILLIFVLLSLIGTTAFRLPTPSRVVGPCAVTPSTVINNAPVSITVSGSGFDASAIVLLNGFGALATTYLNDNVLTAMVPAGVPVGTYDIIVKTDTGEATCTPSLVVNLPNFSRPQVILELYNFSVDLVQVNKEFNLMVQYKNIGDRDARNMQVVFTSDDVLPTQNGGIAPVGDVFVGANGQVEQKFILRSAGTKTRASINVTFNYYDDFGKLYSETVVVSVRFRTASGGGGGGGSSGGGGGGSGIASTPTPVPGNAPQLIISGYSTSEELLQPGLQFKLNLKIKNMGKTKADRITMIVGGGTTGGNGTPSAGGVSGGGGSFGDFAPVGTSNVQSLGSLDAGATFTATQNLIVNVSTEPGAYPLVITFAYFSDKGETINDEQVITLLVYSLPNLDISFYRSLDPFFAGQPSPLPLQIVNLGKRTAVMGNVKVTSDDGTIENGTSLVGALDPGGYFTLDSFLTPNQAGTTTLIVTVEYTDDFNQPRVVTRELEVKVMDAAEEIPLDPSQEGMVPLEEETLPQKIWRFILGLLGLDSAAPGGNSPDTTEPVPVPIGPGGKG